MVAKRGFLVVHNMPPAELRFGRIWFVDLSIKSSLDGAILRSARETRAKDSTGRLCDSSKRFQQDLRTRLGVSMQKIGPHLLLPWVTFSRSAVSIRFKCLSGARVLFRDIRA